MNRNFNREINRELNLKINTEHNRNDRENYNAITTQPNSPQYSYEKTKKNNNFSALIPINLCLFLGICVLGAFLSVSFIVNLIPVLYLISNKIFNTN